MKALFLAAMLTFLLAITPSFATTCWGSNVTIVSPTAIDQSSSQSTLDVGYSMKTNQTIKILDFNVYRHADCAAVISACKITGKTNQTVFYTGTVVSNKTCTFTDAIIEDASEFNIVDHPTTLCQVWAGVPAYPYTSAFANLTQAVLSDSGGAWTTYSEHIFDIDNITYVPEIDCPPPTPTAVKLYLNGNESNITLYENDTLNATATINVTLPLSLLKNDTILNTSDGIVSYYENMTIGEYVYFANWSGNDSYAPANATYYVSVIAVPINYTSPYPANVSYNWCVSNDTLLVHQVHNGTSNYVNDTYTICQYGCLDSECLMKPLYSGLLSFGFIIAFVLILIILDKVLRR